MLSGAKQNVPNLPITRWTTQDGQVITSSFYKVSFWDRLKFLFDGRIYVSLYGKTHQPMSVGIGQMFKVKPREEKS